MRIDMCIDVRMDVWTDMSKVICADMWIDRCIGMRTHLHIDTADMRVDTRVDKGLSTGVRARVAGRSM